MQCGKQLNITPDTQVQGDLLQGDTLHAYVQQLDSHFNLGIITREALRSSTNEIRSCWQFAALTWNCFCGIFNFRYCKQLTSLNTNNSHYVHYIKLVFRFFFFSLLTLILIKYYYYYYCVVVIISIPSAKSLQHLLVYVMIRTCSTLLL